MVPLSHGPMRVGSNYFSRFIAVASVFAVAVAFAVDVRRAFPHADQVDRRTVFNIGGNNYRLIARISYLTQQVFVLAILTHAEYDKEKWK